MAYARSVLNRLLVSAAFAVLIRPTVGKAQDVVLIPDEPTCPRCSIELKRGVELGNTFGDPGAQGGATAFARDSRGLLYVVYESEPYRIFVHDPRTGAVLRTMGREGQGPGEYRRITFLYAGSGDTLHVFDTQRRRTVIAPDGQVARTARLPGSTLSAAVLGHDQVVMSSIVMTRESMGYPIHELAPDGTIARSFGTDKAVFRPDMGATLFRWLGRSTDTTFWVGAYNEYRIEKWDLNGHRQATLTRRIPAFPTWLHSDSRPNPGVVPQSGLLAVWEDDSHRLWCVMRTHDKRWREVVQIDTSVGPDGPRGYKVTDVDRYYDTVVEVIDPAAGRLIVSRRFDKPLGFYKEGYGLIRWEDQGNVRHLSVGHLILTSMGGPL